MDNSEKYFHWLWGDNNLRGDKPQYLINLEHGICIRFAYDLAMFCSYEDFFESIADVQFLIGSKPNAQTINDLLVDAWNYLALEEQALDFIEDEDFESFDE
jgi:hypothetical protein